MINVGIVGCGYVGGNGMHTQVPGPDGKYGYGGKCFPKDVNALAALIKGLPLGKLIAPLHELNVGSRGFEKRV